MYFIPRHGKYSVSWIRKAYENRDKNFGNALFVEKVVAAAIRHMSERTMKISSGTGADPSGDDYHPQRRYTGR
ncbi:MAG: hypothetical protein ACLUD0_16565 [Eubacterium ramulus]